MLKIELVEALNSAAVVKLDMQLMLTLRALSTT